MARRSPGSEPPAAASVLSETAFAKINLTLRVLGKRADGYHEIESLVAFANIGDRLLLTPGGDLALAVDGPYARQAGPLGDNLVLKAANALARRVPGIAFGKFALMKEIPAQAGLGGGSADAAAALRLLARANCLDPADPRLYQAARETGADVPVCLDPRPRWMRGIGENLSPPLTLPPLNAVLVRPDVALATKDVFAALAAAPLPSQERAGFTAFPTAPRDLINFLAAGVNDLESVARRMSPQVGEVLAALRRQHGCELARMSGSGSACFGIFATPSAAAAAAHELGAKRPQWWTRVAVIGADQHASTGKFFSQ